MSAAIAAFLLGFPALFAIVNPVSGAFIFRTRTVDRAACRPHRAGPPVGVYAALVMLVALWAGSYVLAFFGISLPALRCAGGRGAGDVCLDVAQCAGAAGGAQEQPDGRRRWGWRTSRSTR